MHKNKAVQVIRVPWREAFFPKKENNIKMWYKGRYFIQSINMVNSIGDFQIKYLNQ